MRFRSFVGGRSFSATFPPNQHSHSSLVEVRIGRLIGLMESYYNDSRGSDTRQCGRCLLMQPGDKFIDDQYGPVGDSVNVCFDCLDGAFSKRFAPTLDIYSAVETDTDVTMVQEDYDRPTCLGGDGASFAFANSSIDEKEIHARGASSVAYALTNDSGNNNDENNLNYSSPSKQAVGSKRKASPMSTLPLSRIRLVATRCHCCRIMS